MSKHWTHDAVNGTINDENGNVLFNIPSDYALGEREQGNAIDFVIQVSEFSRDIETLHDAMYDASKLDEIRQILD